VPACDNAPVPSLQAVVFDVDGVIADSEPLHLRAYENVLAARSVKLTRQQYYERYLGYDDAGVFDAVFRDRGLSLTAEDRERLIVQKGLRYHELIDSAQLFLPGALDCVRRLAARVPLAIASGALRPEIELILGRGRIGDLFAAIVASGDTPHSKPAPDPYVLAVDLLARARPERVSERAACVAIEDSLWGIESARAAGLRTVAVTHTYAAAELPRADAVVDRLDEITWELLDRIVA
jgi:beta-phosphoglucomutase